MLDPFPAVRTTEKTRPHWAGAEEAWAIGRRAETVGAAVGCRAWVLGTDGGGGRLLQVAGRRLQVAGCRLVACYSIVGVGVVS